MKCKRIDIRTLGLKKKSTKLFLMVVATLMVLKSISFIRNSKMTREKNGRNMNIVILGADSDNERNKKFDSWAPNLACQIPKLNINGSEVIKFFSSVKPLDCQGLNGDDWVYMDNDMKVKIKSEAKIKYGAIECELKQYFFFNDQKVQYADKIVFTDEVTMNISDYAKVICYSKKGKKHENYLMTIFRQENRVKELKAIKKPENWSGLDVYFLGFDSVSQMTFRRKMPKTTKFLEEELEAVVLNGYNIVGDGTPQAFIPILTGKTEEELPLTRKRYPNANFVDDVYPFAWRNFSDSGYITMFAEDDAAVGTYNYRLKGFRNLPADYYLRVFFLESERWCSACECLGSRPLYEDWFRFTSEFMTRYMDVPRFLLAHQSRYSHGSLNAMEYQDEHVVEHFKKLLKSGALDNSVIITMADHGHRFADIRATHQGQLEERLPFFSIALPKKFRESQRGRTAWKNLQNNKDKLTSPFDIHPTLLDILNWPSEEELRKEGDLSKRSLSLFRPIPSSRTCAQAGIDPHWCTCLNWERADTGEQLKTSLTLVSVVIDVMNGHTNPARNLCAELKLKSFDSAKRLVPNKSLLKYRNVLDKDGFIPDLNGSTTAKFAYYQLKFWTTPGNALYEVTIFYNWHSDTAIVDLKSISHVNKYGDLPHCIIDKNYFLAMYCVCYDKITKKELIELGKMKNGENHE